MSMVRQKVAPRAGAWVETFGRADCRTPGMVSHPVRVRGLKLGGGRVSKEGYCVAPRAGAWVETRLGM